MVDPTLPLPGLSPIAEKAIVARFDGGRLSSDGGLLVLRQIERRLSVADRLAACIDDPRDPASTVHTLADIIRFRLLMIAAGYEDANDATGLRLDPLFKMALERLPSERDLCSQSTISRLENLPDARTLLRLGRALVDLYCTSFRQVPRLQLQGQLGLGSYKSAWLLAAKLRRAMVAPGRALLAGLVEVDETTIPLRRKDEPPAGGHGRSHQGKMLVAAGVEVHDGGPGRVRLGAIQDASAESLHAFVGANVEAGATARTDGWSGYSSAPGVTREPHVVGPMAAHIVLPWTHRVFANLKTWALVYHGLRRKHLQSYLDEFAFRFNRRHTRSAAFRSLLGISVAKMPTTYNMLIKPEATA